MRGGRMVLYGHPLPLLREELSRLGSGIWRLLN
jgi:hypothetical protein